MGKTEANVPIDLSVMLGSGQEFEAKDKTYTVKPIMLAHIEDFMADNLSIGSQLFNLTSVEAKAKVSGWLSGYCTNSKGEPMSIQKAMDDSWDIVDLKKFFQKLCDLSG